MSTQIINWFEVNSPNVDSAVNFYRNVFGWTKEPMPMGPDMTYWMLKSGDTVFSGVVDLNVPEMEGVPPHWGLYFHTDNCEATMAKATELGGSVVYGPMEIPDIGIVAGITDCCGAHFNVHQPAGGTASDISGGAVNWVEHMGPTRECAVNFYKSLFGWGSMDMDMGEAVGTYSMFTVGETPVAGCMNVSADQVPPNWTVYLHADDLAATCEKVTAAGGQIINPPMDIGQFGHIAIAADSCGAVFGLHQPPSM